LPFSIQYIHGEGGYVMKGLPIPEMPGRGAGDLIAGFDARYSDDRGKKRQAARQPGRLHVRGVY